VWLAVAVLPGWSAGHGLALLAGDVAQSSVAGARELLAVAAWAACAIAAVVCWALALARRRQWQSGSGAILLWAWFLLGLQAGTRGGDDPPPNAVDAVRLPVAGDRAWFLVRVDAVEEKLAGARWTGRLQTWAAGDGWVQPSAPIAVGGTWNGAACGRYLLLATMGAGGGASGLVFIQVERAWSVAADATPVSATSATARATRWRAGFGDRLIGALGSDAGILAARTFLGPDAPMPPGWDTPFGLTGTMHLLSISGFHFSLLGGVLLLAMRVLLRGARAAKWPAIGLLGGYAWMVGAPAPVQRSWGGALFLASGPSWGRSGRTINSLGLVAAILALLEPRFPAGPSFVLSFAATAGVILGGRATAAWLDVAEDTGGLKRARPLLLALGVSVGATLLTVPWSFHWFGLLYPLGVLANLVAIPAMAVVMAVQVPALFAVAAGAGAGFPFCIVGRLAGDSFLAILRAMAGVSGAWAWTGQLDRVTSLAWLLAVGVALLAAGRCAEARKERARRPGVTLPPGDRAKPAMARAAAWALLLVLPIVAGAARQFCAESRFRGSTLDIRFLDVGQGDATLVRFSGTTWLVDLGLGSMRGRDRLVPQLLRAGVRRVDRAWITHGDADHWGGLIDLLASPVRLDTLVLGEGSDPPEKMRQTLRSARHPPVVVRAAAGWQRPGPAVTVHVLHPPSGFRPQGTNEGSLVLVLESTERTAATPDAPVVPFRVLLPGDLPTEREKAVLAAGGPGAVLVAELAHHGSRTASSPAWWAATRPSLAVISVGSGNSYGLPHLETLAGAARRGAKVLRTDKDGAVRIAFGPRGARVGRTARF
jgi:competence protein ComEC